MAVSDDADTAARFAAREHVARIEREAGIPLAEPEALAVRLTYESGYLRGHGDGMRAGAELAAPAAPTTVMTVAERRGLHLVLEHLKLALRAGAVGDDAVADLDAAVAWIDRQSAHCSAAIVDVLHVAHKIGEDWRAQGGVNAGLLDLLAETVRRVKVPPRAPGEGDRG